MPDAAAVTEKAGLTAKGVEAYLSELSNWGRWGGDDRIGTLNLITDEVRLAATSTIRTGRAIFLSRPIDPLDPDPLDSGFALVQRFMTLNKVTDHIGRQLRYEAVTEYVGIVAMVPTPTWTVLPIILGKVKTTTASRRVIPTHSMGRDRSPLIKLSTASSHAGCYWISPPCTASTGSSAVMRSRRTN